MVPNLVNGEPSKSAASRAEPVVVEDAVRALRSRSPQESLGLSNKSGLMKAFLQAAAGALLLLAVLTVGPYLYEKTFPSAKSEKQTPANQSDSASKPADKPEEPAKKKAELAKEAPKEVPKNFEKTIGEGGVKKGDPKIDRNPFNTKDDLVPK